MLQSRWFGSQQRKESVCFPLCFFLLFFRMVSRQAEGFESTDTVWPFQNASSGRWWNNNAETPIWQWEQTSLLQDLFPFLVLTAGFFSDGVLYRHTAEKLASGVPEFGRWQEFLLEFCYECTEVHVQSVLGCDSFPFRLSNDFHFPNFPFIVISKKSAPVRLRWDRLGQRYARVCFHDWVCLRL